MPMKGKNIRANPVNRALHSELRVPSAHQHSWVQVCGGSELRCLMITAPGKVPSLTTFRDNFTSHRLAVSLGMTMGMFLQTGEQ